MNNAERSEYLAVYAAMRDEILKRMELRNNIISFTLVLAGVFLALGGQLSGEDPSPFPFLLYPILAGCLAAAWTHSDIRVGDLGRYLKKHIEPKMEAIDMRWEHFLKETYNKPGREIFILKYIVQIYAAGVFVVTQLLAIALAIAEFDKRKGYGTFR